MTQISNQEIEKTLRNSECIISSIEVAAAYERLAAQLNLHYVGLNPIVTDLLVKLVFLEKFNVIDLSPLPKS